MQQRALKVKIMGEIYTRMWVPAKPLSCRIFELDKLRYDHRNHVLAARTATKKRPMRFRRYLIQLDGAGISWKLGYLLVLENTPADIYAERGEEGRANKPFITRFRINFATNAYYAISKIKKSEKEFARRRFILDRNLIFKHIVNLYV